MQSLKHKAVNDTRQRGGSQKTGSGEVRREDAGAARGTGPPPRRRAPARSDCRGRREVSGRREDRPGQALHAGLGSRRPSGLGRGGRAGRSCGTLNKERSGPRRSRRRRRIVRRAGPGWQRGLRPLTRMRLKRLPSLGGSCTFDIAAGGRLGASALRFAGVDSGGGVSSLA